MKIRKKNHTAMSAAALLALTLVLVLILAGRLGKMRESSGYSEKQVSLEEIKEELSFGIYREEDWDAYFAAYHKAYLTGELLEQLLARLGVENYIEAPKVGKKSAVLRADWNAVYGQILDYLDMKGEITKQSFLVLDTMEAKEENVIVTNQGDYYTKLPVSYFEKWKAYEVFAAPEERCLGIAGSFAGETDILNAYLKTYGEEGIVFLYRGAEYTVDAGKTEDETGAGVCDLIFREGRLEVIRMKKDVIAGQLLSYDENSIEIEGYGKIGHEGKLPVYQTYGEVTEKSISDVVLGNMEVEYVTGENMVCAVLIRQPAEIADIRVLLLAEGGGKFRGDVYLRCSTSSVISYGDTAEAVAPDTLIHVPDYLPAGAEQTFVCQPDTEDGMVYLCDTSGASVSNGYYGTMEVRAYQDGYALVNELPFEKYLYAVVPSEMPSTYEPEALKAQAVCARSYAYMQLLRADLAEYGAHIDDSTSYQVYNKTARTDSSVAAVNETAGKVLTYQGNVIEAYYFSTSMGYTGCADIWNVEENGQYDYLKSVCLNTAPYEGDLSQEAGFLDYITNTAEGYDSSIKYYRWFAAADYSGKTGTINEILNSRRQVSGKNIQYYGEDGVSERESPGGFGEVTGISVKERSSSGAVLCLLISYEKGSAQVKTEYNIRKVLGCGVKNIVYADSSNGGETPMLPSAYCAVTAQQDGTYLIQGGGYGHGLGMSQNGANGMAKTGMNYEDILHYFYNDIKIEDMTQ